MKRIPVNEQETTIQYDRDGEYARIWTSDSTTITKLDKLVKRSENWECTATEIEDDSHWVVAREYRCPKRCVSFRTGKTTRKRNSDTFNPLEDN